MATNTPAPLGQGPPAEFQVDLTGDVRELPILREHCARTLAALPDSVIGDVQLVVSELASNVHRHTHDRTGHVLVRQDSGDVHVAVSDLSSIPPTLLRNAPVGGRGVAIVDAVARTWGVTREAFGKTVWADIEIHT